MKDTEAVVIQLSGLLEAAVSAFEASKIDAAVACLYAMQDMLQQYYSKDEK